MHISAQIRTDSFCPSTYILQNLSQDATKIVSHVVKKDKMNYDSCPYFKIGIQGHYIPFS